MLYTACAQVLVVVWVVDSFEGCPKPDAEAYPQDASDRHHTFTNLQVSLQKVSSNFADFGLLGPQVEFVRGWFRDSMYSERVEAIESLALLRLDGDLYQSTIEALRGGYYKVSVGGVVIVDDWRLDGMQARQAVIDFHQECNIPDEIRVASDGLAWWTKGAPSDCG
ncbi:Macrocin-O-methyltransferase [Baffinella frigidus]|nr:Macrocin-O-methyltransferase [Cryptophyta sp. CCMP2293]